MRAHSNCIVREGNLLRGGKRLSASLYLENDITN